MKQNKMSKYVKYAIGEILLVVIGILIALQINNWNEIRKLKTQETTYYCQLIDDLKADIANIDITTKSLKDRQVATRRVLTNLLKIQEKKDTLLSDYLPSIRSKSFVPTKAAIKDITSSGKLENLTNQVHKNAILSYYVQQDVNLKIIEGNNSQLWQKIFAYNDYTDFGLNELPLYRDLYGDDLQGLLNSKEWQRNPRDPIFRHFMDHMNMTIIICDREKDLLTALKTKAEDLVNLIQSGCN